MDQPHKVSIPSIAITYDETTEPEEPQTTIPIPRTIHTDVEDLDSDNGINITKSDVLEGYYLSLLKEDEGHTDVEAIENSEEEDAEIVSRPLTPLPPEDMFDYGQIISESVKLSQAENAEEKDLKFITEKQNQKTFIGLETYDLGYTDVEDFAASGEEAIEEDKTIEDVDISEMVEGGMVGITDKIKNRIETYPAESSSSELSDQSQSKKKNRKSSSKKISAKKNMFLTSKPLSPTLSDVTDVEAILSDSEDDQNSRSKNHETKHLAVTMLINDKTDVEELSGNEELQQFQPKFKKHSKKIRESNADKKRKFVQRKRSSKSGKKIENAKERLNTSPTSQLIEAMSSAGLKIEALEGAAVTDMEDFGNSDDRDDERKLSSSESDEMVQILRDFECLYGSTSESFKEMSENNLSLNSAPGSSKKLNKGIPYIRINNTSSDESDRETESNRKVCQRYSSKKKAEPKLTFSEFLTVERKTDEILTEAEVLESSDNENIRQGQLSISGNEDVVFTDVEDFSTDDELENHNSAQHDIEPELPKLYRKMILITENKDGCPISNVMPLDEAYLTAPNENDNVLTDVEDCAASELSDGGQHPPSPDLLAAEPSTIQETESIKTEKKKKLKPPGRNIFESVTDSEDVFFDDGNERKKKKCRNKNLSRNKSDEYLRAEVEFIKGGTDVEELAASDREDLKIAENVFVKRNAEGGRNANADEHITDNESIILTSAGESDEGYQASSNASEIEKYVSIEHDISEATFVSGGGEKEMTTQYLGLKEPKECKSGNVTYTDVEDIFTATEDDNDDQHLSSEDCTMEPSSSTIYIKNFKSVDYEEPDEILHLKVYKETRENHTDAEDIIEDEASVCHSEDQNSFYMQTTNGEMEYGADIVSEISEEIFTFETFVCEYKNNFNRNSVPECNNDTKEKYNEFCVCVSKSEEEIASLNFGWTESVIYFSEEEYNYEEHSEKGQSECIPETQDSKHILQLLEGNKIESKEEYQITYPVNLIPIEKEDSKHIENLDVGLNETDDFFLALIPEQSLNDTFSQSEISLKQQLLNSVTHLIEDDITERSFRTFFDDFPEEGEMKSLDKEILENVLKEEPYVLHEECDDYCTYIKKIEQDSYELENHLRALRLVESPPEIQHRQQSFRKPVSKKVYADESYINKFLRHNEVKKFNFCRFDSSQSSTSESESKDSSLEDFILKLNESDEEILIPKKESSEYSCQNKENLVGEGDKEHSRSLDDLSFSKGIERDRSFSGLFTVNEDLPQQSQNQGFGISRLLIDGKDVHTFSRSVLDLTKVGLSETSKNAFGNKPDDVEESQAIALPKTKTESKAEIKLLVKTVDSGKSEIEIRSISQTVDPTQSNMKTALENDIFLDRRCSEVFGRRADSSPYSDDMRIDGKPPIPASLTQSLQSLYNKKNQKHAYRNYDQLQSMQCLFQEKPQKNLKLSSSLKRSISDATKNTCPKIRSFEFQVRDRPLDDSVSLTHSSAINRVFVRSPYEKEMKNLNEPKKLKSILKKPANFRPIFESISLTSMNTQSSTLGRDSFIKLSMEKSRSCGNVSTNEKPTLSPFDPFSKQSANLKIKSFDGKYSNFEKIDSDIKATSNWNKYVVPTSPLSRNRSVSSSSLQDSKTGANPVHVATTINPPATLIRYVTTTQSSPNSSPQPEPYVAYYDWSKQDVSEDEVNLSDFECTKIHSDTELQDDVFDFIPHEFKQKKRIKSDQVPEVEKQIDPTRRTIQTETKIETFDEQISPEKRGGLNFEELDLSSASQPKESESTGYVTTPTSSRRVQSQRIPTDQRPSVTPYQGDREEVYSSDEEANYTVDEPEDLEPELGRIHSSPDIYRPVSTQKRKGSSLAETLLTEEETPIEEVETEVQKNGSDGKIIDEPKSESETADSELVKEKDGKCEIKEPSITESVEKSEKTFEYDGADVTSEASQSIISNTETLLDAPKAGLITDSGISTASKDISDLTETEQDAVGKEISKVKEEPDESDKSEAETKPRVIFHIESEEDLQSDIECDQIPIPIDSSSSTEEFIEKVKQDLRTTLEREQLILEEKLSMRSRIFDDLSDESLSKTKELVDERLRKISESRIPKEPEEPVIMTKKEEKNPLSSEPVEEIKIGRFHVTPAQVDDPLEDKEKVIAERLKTDYKAEELNDEIEKELPEKLTEEDLEEVIRELKMEGLKTDIYLEKDEEKEEKKEKTLKRVERRFERMASETLEKEKEEENVSEETLNEKREVEFQRMISQLSTEEVAECQQEYLHLWDEGGLSSLTPTDEWESRDPDTPENELEEDSPRKPESYRGSHGQGKYEESIPKTSSKPDVSTNIKTSPLESVNISDDISPVTQSLGIVDPLQVGSSPSDTRQSSDFASEELQSYGDRKKFWEQMSSSQSSETGSEHRKSFHESLSSKESFEIEKKSKEESLEKESESSIEEEHISVKSARQKFESQENISMSQTKSEKRKSTEEGSLVKSLTESFSEKINAGELIMPALPRPKSSVYKDVIEGSGDENVLEAPYLKKQIIEGSSGTLEVSELEAELQKRRAGAPITDETVMLGSTSLEHENFELSTVPASLAAQKADVCKLTQGASTDSEAEFLSKYGEESVAFDNSAFVHDDDIPLEERKKEFEENLNKRPPPVMPIRKTIYERSMSLPPQELGDNIGLKAKKRYFENQLQKEIVVEQLMTQQDEECSTEIKSIADSQKQLWTPPIQEKKITKDESEQKITRADYSEEENLKESLPRDWKEEIIKEKEKTQGLIEEKRKSIEVKETAVKVINDLIKEGAKVAEEKLNEQSVDALFCLTSDQTISSSAEEVIQYKSDTLTKPSDSLEVHVDKSEIEGNEKQKDIDEVLNELGKKDDDAVPSITVAHCKKLTETSSNGGESEDTQSESDVTPEDARVVDNGNTPWESGGNSPKDDLDLGREIGEVGMGRWIGQEDLSKEIWEKDDVDSSPFQIEPKWERTRSEGASPKEQFVYTPEEHYPDTVWEVPVQEQLENEEITQDIPIEKQVIIEKDEEEEEEEEEEEVEEDDDEEEIGDIRGPELTEEEAREIAEEILEYIQYEVENRSSLLITDLDEDAGKHPPEIPHPQVSDYLRQLAGEKNLDDREVELIESVLVQKHREHILKLKNNETTSSQEITDEDLRSSGVETDLSPLDSQAGKLQILGEEEIDSMETSEGIIEGRIEELDEKSIKEELEDLTTKDDEKSGQKLKDEDILEQTIAEVKESLEAAQEELIEQHKKKKKDEVFKKESPSEFEFKGISYEKSKDDKIEERYYEEAERSTEFESIGRKGKKIDQYLEGKVAIQRETSSVKTEGKIHLESDADNLYQRTTSEYLNEVEVAKQEKKESTHIHDADYGMDVSEKLNESSIVKSTEIKKRQEIEERSQEENEKQILLKARDENQLKLEKKASTAQDVKITIAEGEIQLTAEKKTEKELLHEKEDTFISTETKKEETSTGKVVATHHVSKTTESARDSYRSESTTEQHGFEKLQELEISPENIILKKFDTKTSMEDSPKSVSQEESVKSPLGLEEYLSSSSSIGKQGDGFKSDKSDIILRHSSSSGTSGLLKADRRSGADLEPYSSSGESHYHSLDQSRPCSSDVEALIAGGVGTGSSEYESALSQELSSQQTTSAEYVTAVSSLSSRESIKSLDSESSGHLGSIEVSSEASETLIPSALELDKDFDSSGVILLDDDSPEMLEGRKVGRPPPYITQMSAPATSMRLSVDEDFEVISESEVASWTGEISEDEMTEGVTVNEEQKDGEKHPKMKRSHEMTFQPEPRPIVSSGSLETSPGDALAEKYIYGSSMDETASMISTLDEKFGSSLEETGSVLSMSLSTASEASAVKTVIEMSRADSEKMDASLTISAGSADSGSREELNNLTPAVVQPQTQEMSTSTPISSSGRKTASVTITTSAIDDHGIPSVSTQVTSVSRKSSMADDSKSESDSNNVSHANGPTQVEYIPEYDEVETTKMKKTQGHRRKESTSNFVPTMLWTVGETKPKKEVKVEMGGFEERTESDKYVQDVILTEKEVKNDEKKEADDSEKLEESHETEADQGFQQNLRDSRLFEEETEYELQELESSRPQSQISKTDSESGRRPVSSVLSEDQPDSEFSELIKQGSSETERDDLIERPASPEPEEFENKDDTPEFSSEAQASITELELEYSGAYSRRDEYISHVSPIREEKSEERFDHIKKGEAEAAFSAVPHTIPHISGAPPETIMENPIAEKHELEEREKELFMRKVTEIIPSPGDIPDITVTQHMTPLLDKKFHYPDLEIEAAERRIAESQILEESFDEKDFENAEGQEKSKECHHAEKNISKGEKPIKESKIQQKESESLDSPNSDSFEMLDKPDISDEYVIIEEVGREAEETDQEGKGVQISARKRKVVKKDDEEKDLISSPPAPATKLTELKYFPGEEDVGPFQFDSDSPPIATNKKIEKFREKSNKDEDEDSSEYDQQLEESKKWIEMQFQGEQAAKVMGGYGYDIEFERGPLEDIKEEEIGELDSSSKIGSMGSQKESLGSFGSVKDSFSSTPDYDVLAGRKYFTRSGDHDDVSMSSLQEFELLEKKILMENGKKSGSSSSQDSLSSKKLGTSNKSGQGDDLSLSSLREFENLEIACVTVVKMEHRAKEEEALLSEIDEGHESQVSESESCETVSGVLPKGESDSEDFDKRMFEIDEIIKQAQSNVEKFTDLRGIDKTESVGRGDSIEEVAKVPDLELDAPLPGRSTFDSDTSLHGAGRTSYSTQVVTKKKIQQWREEDQFKKPELLSMENLSVSTDSLEIKPGDKIMTESTDSIEFGQEKHKKGNIMTDSLEMQADTMSIDSFDAQCKEIDKKLTDSMEDDEISAKGRGHESSSSGREADYSSSGKEDSEVHGARVRTKSDYMLGSTDSLDPSSSTATHATYQYETDSVMSSSFTSGGSNTMVSSTDNLDLTLTGTTGLENIDVSSAAKRTDIWFEKLKVGSSEPIVTEVIEPLQGDQYSHTIHRTVEMAPEVRKVIFKGPEADDALKEYVEGFAPGEEVIETEEIDEHGNVHIKRIVRRKLVLKTEEFGGKQPTEDELEAYLRKFEKEGFDSKKEFGTEEFGDDFTMSYNPNVSNPPQTTAYSLDKKLTGKEEGQSSSSKDEPTKGASTTEKETGIASRPPLVSDISMDDEAEYDTTEHDWRRQLEILHAEAEEGEIDEGEIDEQLDAALASSFTPHHK